MERQLQSYLEDVNTTVVLTLDPTGLGEDSLIPVTTMIIIIIIIIDPVGCIY